ncbi:MAG: MFS transporter [Chloroflexota bacterium]
MERASVGVGTAAVPRFGPAAWAARRGLHYGWVVVAVTFLIVITAAGVRSAPGVLIRPLEAEFGWRRGEISLALSLGLFTYGLAAPLSGRIADRFGLRAMTLGFLSVAGVGVALAVLLQHLWQLHLFWGLIVGLGTGGIATVLSATVANTWFQARRGLITGILGGASSAGQLVFVPVLVWVTAQWGWRAAVGLLATLLLGVVLPAALLLMRSRPADLGLRPYGAGPATADAAALQPLTPVSVALRTGDFWLLALSFAVCGFTTMGLIGTHFIPHAVEHGFTETQAAGILSVIGGMNVVGTVVSGWLCDRFAPRKLLAAYYFFRALSLLALPFIRTVPLMSLFAVVYGFDYIATVPPTVMLTADRFGRRSVGTIFGWISFAHMVGGAVAASFAGAIHDAVGDYTVAIYIAGLLGLLAAGMAFSVRPVRRAIAPAPA